MYASICVKCDKGIVNLKRYAIMITKRLPKPPALYGCNHCIGVKQGISKPCTHDIMITIEVTKAFGFVWM